MLGSISLARTWTSASDPGKTFEGELVGNDQASGKVTVDMNGRMMSFKQDLLSEADIAFAKENGPKLATQAAPAGGDATVNGSVPDVLPDPDGKEADTNKPVQVFIMMGQSNMLGFGNAGSLKGRKSQSPFP